MVTWSYSSIKTFDQCAKKYYHQTVVKDVKWDESESLNYGKEVHSAAEKYIKHKTPVPDKFKQFAPMLETLGKIEGTKHCEIRLGVKLAKDGYAPCDFFDKDVWWRGVIDLLIVNGAKAMLVDYKTNKNARYADTKQLDLLAAATFLHFPEVKKIKSALAFVVSDEFIQKEHDAVLRDSYMATFEPELERLEMAYASGVWDPTSGPLCGWCPVQSCVHWRERK